MAGKTIKITSTNANGSTVIGINGRNRRLPHNKEVAVSEAELENLENSRVKFEVVGSGNPGKAAVDAPNSEATVGPATSGVPAGADTLEGTGSSAVAGVPVRLTPEASDTPAGADSLRRTSTEVDEAAAREAALGARDAASEGTQEPAVVLTNADPDQTGSDQAETTDTGGDASEPGASEAGSGDGAGDNGRTLNRSPFSAKTTLEQPVKKITEDMDEFTPAQLRALLKAEQGEGGQNRAGLVAALERKLAS